MWLIFKLLLVDDNNHYENDIYEFCFCTNFSTDFTEMQPGRRSPMLSQTCWRGTFTVTPRSVSVTKDGTTTKMEGQCFNGKIL